MSEFKDVAHKTVAELFDMLKEKQVEVDSLKAQLNNLKAQVNSLKHQKSLQELEISQISQANQEWQKINGELAKALRGAND
ncbi:MAG TPA: hypothetical protein K8V79_13000 [Acinetobacter lwoffii]|uniref:Uncharacterized protein n=1 Tax=Acinetobacter lwoffii TaxID=28090 RepID=A0A9D2UUS0_ACILW|nr:hypothetical protein [Acinetobacter lwoffii]